MSKSLFSAAKMFLLVALLTFGVIYVQATWNEPTATPPGDNTAAPVNVGTTDQVKSAGLGVDSLAVFGNATVDGYAQIGETAVTCNGSLAGAIRYASSTQVLQYCDESEWVDLVATTSPSEEALIGGKSLVACTSMGGTVVDVPGGKICQVSAGTCPGGWGQYLNWSVTQPRSCTLTSGNGVCGSPTSRTITTGSHVWADTAPETTSSSLYGQWCGPACGAEHCYTRSFSCTATTNTVGCI